MQEFNIEFPGSVLSDHCDRAWVARDWTLVSCNKKQAPYSLYYLCGPKYKERFLLLAWAIVQSIGCLPCMQLTWIGSLASHQKWFLNIVKISPEHRIWPKNKNKNFSAITSKTFFAKTSVEDPIWNTLIGKYASSKFIYEYKFIDYIKCLNDIVKLFGFSYLIKK